MTDVEVASNLIAYFEQYIGYARWDVNAYRCGFGSDTEGPECVPVHKDTTTTRERALSNLAVRVPKFIVVAAGQVGPELWAKLGLNTKAALTSMAYNYGSIPENVVFAVKNNSQGVATAIRARAGDNHGINSWRRDGEAACVALDGGQY